MEWNINFGSRGEVFLWSKSFLWLNDNPPRSVTWSWILFKKKYPGILQYWTFCITKHIQVTTFQVQQWSRSSVSCNSIFHEGKRVAQTSQHIIHCVNLTTDPQLSRSDGQHMPLKYYVHCHYVNDAGCQHPAAAVWQAKALSHHYTPLLFLMKSAAPKQRIPSLLSDSLNYLTCE